MEEFKTSQPLFSHACEKLYTRIVDLIMPHGELNPHMQDISMQQQAEQSQISARLRWKD
jgi:hypothetical protein